MSWFSRPSLLLFLYGVPSLGLALASLSLYSRLASRQGYGSLLTCLLVGHGPGRTSRGTSAPGCTLLASDGYAHIPLGAAQLVCSQLFVGLPKGLAFFHTFHFGWYFPPAICHSYAVLNEQVMYMDRSFLEKIPCKGIYSMYGTVKACNFVIDV